MVICISNRVDVPQPYFRGSETTEERRQKTHRRMSVSMCGCASDSDEARLHSYTLTDIIEMIAHSEHDYLAGAFTYTASSIQTFPHCEVSCKNWERANDISLFALRNIKTDTTARYWGTVDSPNEYIADGLRCSYG